MRRRAQFAAFVTYDVFAYVKTEAVVCERVEDGYTLVRHSPHSYLDTLTIAEAQVPARWGRGEADPTKAAHRLKVIGLRDGATPEAIRCLGLIVPISTTEEYYMAEKLKGKKTADTKGLKEAAKKTPVAKAPTEGTKKRGGNVEALNKAREAKRAAAGPDTRKIKALKKAKDLDAREGTFRRQMLEDALASKTVQEFRDKNSKYDAGCLRFAIESGTISVS